MVGDFAAAGMALGFAAAGMTAGFAAACHGGCFRCNGRNGSPVKGLLSWEGGAKAWSTSENFL